MLGLMGVVALGCGDDDSSGGAGGPGGAEADAGDDAAGEAGSGGETGGTSGTGGTGGTGGTADTGGAGGSTDASTGGSGGGAGTGGTGSGSTVGDTGVDQVVLDAIENHGLNIVGGPSTVEVSLPAELNDANWGLKQMICVDAGYSLAPYAGQNVLLTTYDIDMTCQGALLRVWVVTQGNEVACVYLSVREGVDLVPGVFSVNEQNC